MAREEEDTTIYRVVMNNEEQYSIWPADREDAPGWKDAGKSGTKAECTVRPPLELRSAVFGFGSASKIVR
jgi:hypothetical protein